MSPTSGAAGVGRPNENVMTSVAPACPRWRRFSAAIARRDTNAMDSIAAGTRSRRSTKPARSRTAPAASDRRRRPVSTSIARSAFEFGGIGLDDLADQPMAHHVHVRGVVERDAIDALQDPLDLDESGFVARRQV